MSHILVVWVALYFDVVVLKSGETITGKQFEIRLYKAFKRRIVATFHGSDSRPPFLAPNASGLTAEELRARTIETRARTDRVREYADVVVDNPLSAHNQASRCCIYQVLGNPIGPKKLRLAHGARALNAFPEASGRNVRLQIVHAPSSPKLKGTALIRGALEALRDEGHVFDYREISGRPIAEVMQLLATADLVIDELYSDMHGAVFAQEACCFGCAVIVGGYGLEELNRYVPEEARLPTFYVHPDEITGAIRTLLVDADKRRELSERAERYIGGYGDYRAVAARLVRLADGTAPDSWFFDPGTIGYVGGTAGPREAIQASLRLLLKAYGPESLLMDDKPALRQALLDFAAEKKEAQAEVAQC
jgi:hypothetical protein